MLSSVEQAFVEREEIRAPLKMPAWEANVKMVQKNNLLHPEMIPRPLFRLKIQKYRFINIYLFETKEINF